MTRIIAGSAKGCTLVTPNGQNTRPTTDRVREAAFSIITSWAGCEGGLGLDGLAFLDLYAGSGAVALEAASRGAAPVWAVESAASAAAVIKRNSQQSGLPLRVITRKVAQVLGDSATAFDVVWADPPYALSDTEIEATLAALVTHGWLAEQALVVVERSTRSAELCWPFGLKSYDVRRFGETSLQLATKGC